MSYDCEIIAVGSELLTPHRLDTNSLFLTAELNRLGFQVRRKHVIGDEPQALTQTIAGCWDRGFLTVVTGGLGPTEDDLTRECAAAALGVELRRDCEQERWLRERFQSRGYAVTQRNLKQADVLSGAELLPNPNGSAPGQWLVSENRKQERRLLVLLPGPPGELKPMVEAELMPRLGRLVPATALVTETLRIAGLAESEVDERSAPVYKRFPRVETTILASLPGEIELYFRASAPTEAEARAQAHEVAALVAAELGNAVYSHNGELLEQIAGHLLLGRGQTLATAESCTGGIIASRMTHCAGASQYYLGGLVTYANSAKRELAGVGEETLERYGAVSGECARELAEGVRQRFHADWGISVTGIAGPSGGSEEKPVGTVYFGLSGSAGVQTWMRQFHGNRERIQRLAAAHALNALRLRLLEETSR